LVPQNLLIDKTDRVTKVDPGDGLQMIDQAHFMKAQAEVVHILQEIPLFSALIFSLNE
jgi:uncharacterized protein YabN with tetrapyrrole methylase and pyrophosphatase domain